ncbi:class I SAM-dependent methyltransferase [Speluncibacter jeojiensis]|uniref:Class I SAM-dependent methyltransferase n=1 Tax=Speluncibacter jeojiensis TaxID=2710754 RepID=A0A9X4M325_9ACTN|nr:class I SAM-dependent methyltransferase [Corynebacteriales bacterium D3-21]
MGPWYKLYYRVGFTPWERAGARFVAVLDVFLAREGLTPGRALDVGCGTGRHAIELASRGWQVTGLDRVPLALERARRRAAAAQVDVTFVEADVTNLPAGVGDGFDLVIDLGCFHGLGVAERDAYGRGLDLAASPGANLLMFAFAPQRLPRLLPRGVSRADLERALSNWMVAGESAADVTSLPAMLGRADPHWFHLVHR